MADLTVSVSDSMTFVDTLQTMTLLQAFLATQSTSYAGTVAVSHAVAVQGITLSNTAVEWVRIENTHVSASRTITIVTQQQVESKAVDDQTVVLAAGDAVYIGPWNRTLYNDSDARVVITFSDNGADLVAEVFKLAAVGS